MPLEANSEPFDTEMTDPRLPRELWRHIGGFGGAAFPTKLSDTELPQVKQLQTRFALWGPEDARANNNYALQCAAGNGNLDVCRWLHATFGLATEDARANDNYALRWAATSGHDAVG